MSRSAIAGLVAIALLGAPGPAALAGDGPETEDGPTETVAEATHATIDVVLLDPGVEPREELRYAWREGQVEHHVVVMRMGMRQVIEGEWTPWMGLPANEIAATTTVTAAHDDGTYGVEVVFTDVSIPKGSATLPPEVLTELEDQMSSMVGMTQVLLVDDRGRILSAETSLPTGADLGSLQPGQLDAATTDFIDPLPAEPVGVGAVWEVAKQSSDGMGFVTYGANTYTLKDIDSAGLLHLSGEMTMTADSQPMSVPGVPPSLDATLDRFDIEGGLTKTVDLDLVNPSEASSRAVARYVFSVAFGDTAETTELEMSMEMDARVLDSVLGGPADE